MRQSPSHHQSDHHHDAPVTRELFMLPSHLEILKTYEQGEALRLIARENNVTPIFPRHKYDTAICLRGTLKGMANFIRQVQSFFVSKHVEFLFEEPLVCRFIIPVQRVPLILGVDNCQIQQLMAKHQCDIVILTPQESTAIPRNDQNKYCEMVVIGDEENIAWLHNEVETIYVNQQVKVLNGPPIDPPSPSPLEHSASYLYHPTAPMLPDVSSLNISSPPRYTDLTGLPIGAISPPPQYDNAIQPSQQSLEPPPQHDPTHEEIVMECTSTRDLEFRKDNIISRVLFFPESIDNLLTEASPEIPDSPKGPHHLKRRGRKPKKNNRFQEFLDYLGSAHRKLDIAIYNLTDDRVCTTLLRLHKKGIAIRIFTDYKMVWTMGNDINTLRSHGIQVRYFKGSGFNLMHHKFTIVDDTLLINGSFNYSRNAAEGNHENIFITNIPIIVQQYVAQFETIYNGGVPPHESDSNPNGDDTKDSKGLSTAQRVKHKKQNQKHR